MTDPVKFSLGDHHITSASHSNTAGTLLGIFAGMLAIGMAIAAVLFYRYKNTLKSSTNGNVAFENPSYLREVNMDNVQVSFGHEFQNFSKHSLETIFKFSDLRTLSRINNELAARAIDSRFHNERNRTAAHLKRCINGNRSEPVVVRRIETGSKRCWLQATSVLKRILCNFFALNCGACHRLAYTLLPPIGTDCRLA